MIRLSEGALDAIVAGYMVEEPTLQILGHKKLASPKSGEHYRLMLSDGCKINSFTMLATELNDMIDTELTDFTVVKIKRYAISTVKNDGKTKRAMVILSLEVKVPGFEVGGKIGNPTQMDTQAELEQAAAPQSKPQSFVPAEPSTTAALERPLDDSVSASAIITTTPIAALSPFYNRWVLKVRVSNKPPIRKWVNSRGEGKLFSMDLMDQSGEIRCTAFKEQCDKFYDMIEVGKVYYISRCNIKPANKQFSSLENDFEITMNRDTEIVACHDDVHDIPTVGYDFHPLSEVETREKNDIIDVLGIVKSYDMVRTLTAKNTGKEMRKRDIQLVDMSNVQVSLTLWGTQAEEFNAPGNPVIAIKRARIGEYNGGKHLSTLNSSMLRLDPNLPEAHRLRAWYNATGKKQHCKILWKEASGVMNAPLTTVYGGAQKCLQLTDSAETYVIKGYVGLIQSDNAFYKSCPNEGCKKKLVDQANETYRCEKCNEEFSNFKLRFLTNVCIVDWTGHQFVTAFNDEVEKLLGVTPEEISELKERNVAAYDKIFEKPVFESYFFKIRSKKEAYNDGLRVKSVMTAVGPVDCKVYHSHLLQDIKRLANFNDDTDERGSLEHSTTPLT